MKRQAVRIKIGRRGEQRQTGRIKTGIRGVSQDNDKQK
jgi:hypothetical protein